MSPHRQCVPKFSLKCCRTNLLSLLILLGVLIGVVVGVCLQLNGVKLDEEQTTLLKFPGEMFLQMMKMVMIPVVVSSLVTATADIDVSASGKIGLRALVYYVVTLVIASVLGISLCLAIQPGSRTKRQNIQGSSNSVTASPLFAFLDLVRNLIPENLVEACFMSKATSVTELIDTGTNSYIDLENGSFVEARNSSIGNRTVTRSTQVKNVPGANMIGLVAVSVLTGAIISHIGQAAKPVHDLLKGIRLIVFQMVGIFLWYSPIGIGFLILSTFAGLTDLASSLENLAIFTVTVYAGLLIHVLVILPLIYFVFVRQNPYPYLRNMIPAMLVAFGSESSGATIPVTIRCLEEKNGLDPRVTRLIASLGATINMDGTTCYFSMMAIFLAQLSGISLTAGQIFTISVMSVSLSIGVGCVPGAQLAYMVMIPVALNLPSDNVSMLFAVDWLLARSRTVANIIGDGFGAGIVQSLSSRELRPSLPQVAVCKDRDNTAENTPLTVGKNQL